MLLNCWDASSKLNLQKASANISSTTTIYLMVRKPVFWGERGIYKKTINAVLHAESFPLVFDAMT